MTQEGAAQDSVPVPDDTDKRSVAVQHIVRMRTKPDDPPDTLVDKAMAAWSAKRNPPNQWRVVNAATGNSLGACAVPITVSVDKTSRRPFVPLERLQDALQKQKMGAISIRALRPDYGNNASRFLNGNAEKGAKLFCRAYRDDKADVLERKCNGTALPSDRGVVVEAAKGGFPVKLKGKYAQVESELVILQSTIVAREGDSSRGWLFVADNEKDARALCLRSVSTSVWKCLQFDSTPHAIYAWTSAPRDSPFNVPAGRSVRDLQYQRSTGGYPAADRRALAVQGGRAARGRAARPRLLR